MSFPFKNYQEFKKNCKNCFDCCCSDECELVNRDEHFMNGDEAEIYEKLVIYFRKQKLEKLLK